MGKDERIIELVRLSKLGNAHAFAELYEMIYQDLYRTALYNLGNVQDAENAVSDTVLDAYAGIGRLRDEGAFRGWIFKILSNKVNRILRDYVAKRQNQMNSSIGGVDNGIFIDALKESMTFNANVFEKALSVNTMCIYVLVFTLISLIAMVVLYTRVYKK